MGRGANGGYGRYDEPGRGTGQAVCRDVRANGDAENDVKGKIVNIGPIFQ
ncbi:conserved protein of unknown function [Xenorhabdus doucetiae]|uniref:Uncharacterized protein n=1 Tax=Xenorhabdus doucetiae TaxID=351671 RepID=A0A068QQB6_9GAMM|nr:conserved protein of unknown function [Xenorhabdus doucetiae]